ncbi:hypothetical protein ACJJTC_009671 [Scirpophaga incertulas]
MSQHGYPERLSNRSKGFQDESQSQHTMEVLVETLTGTAFEMTVSPSDTIFAIKSKIFRVEGIPVSQQHLLYNLKELDDSASLAEQHIGDGARLRLVLGMSGGPVATRRLPPPEPWHDLERLLENNGEEMDWGSNGCKVTVLVFREGERVNMLRVRENRDGSYSPVELKRCSTSDRASDRKSDRDRGVASGTSRASVDPAEAARDNAVTMTKMMDLRRRMESLSVRRRPPREGTCSLAPGEGSCCVAHRKATCYVAPREATCSLAPGEGSCCVAHRKATCYVAPREATCSLAPGEGSCCVAHRKATCYVAPREATCSLAPGEATCSLAPGEGSYCVAHRKATCYVAPREATCSLAPGEGSCCVAHRKATCYVAPREATAAGSYVLFSAAGSYVLFSAGEGSCCVAHRKATCSLAPEEGSCCVAHRKAMCYVAPREATCSLAPGEGSCCVAHRKAMCYVAPREATCSLAPGEGSCCVAHRKATCYVAPREATCSLAPGKESYVLCSAAGSYVLFSAVEGSCCVAHRKATCYVAPREATCSLAPGEGSCCVAHRKATCSLAPEEGSCCVAHRKAMCYVAPREATCSLAPGEGSCCVAHRKAMCYVAPREATCSLAPGEGSCCVAHRKATCYVAPREATCSLAPGKESYVLCSAAGSYVLFSAVEGSCCVAHRKATCYVAPREATCSLAPGEAHRKATCYVAPGEGSCCVAHRKATCYVALRNATCSLAPREGTCSLALREVTCYVAAPREATCYVVHRKATCYVASREATCSLAPREITFYLAAPREATYYVAPREATCSLALREVTCYVAAPREATCYSDTLEIQKTKSEETLSGSRSDERYPEMFKPRCYQPYSIENTPIFDLDKLGKEIYEYDCPLADQYALPPIGTRTNSESSIPEAVETERLSSTLAGPILVKGGRREDEASVVGERLDRAKPERLIRQDPSQLSTKRALAPIPAAEYGPVVGEGSGWRGSGTEWHSGGDWRRAPSPRYLSASSPQLDRLPHRYVLRSATGRPQPAAGPPAAPVRTARRHWPPAARSWAACRTGTYCAAPLAARSPQLGRLPHRYVLRGATGRPQPAAGPPAAPVRTARRHWPPAARSWAACRTGTYCAAPLAARSPQLGRLPHRYVLRGATGRPQPAAGPPAAPVRTAQRHWPPAARSWAACRTGTYCAAPLAARSPQLGRLPHRYVLRGATGRPQPAAGPPAAPVRTAQRHWPPAARSWAACRTGTYCAAPLAARSPQLGRLPHRYVLRSATGRPQPAAGPPAAPVRTARRHWPPAARSWAACRTGTYCAAPLAARSPQLGRLPHRYVLRSATGRPQPAAGPPAAPVRTARRHWPPAARSWAACRTGTYCAAPLAARSPQLGRLPHRYVLRSATGRPQPAAGPPAAPVRTARRHWPPAARSWAACRTGTYCAAPLAARSPQLGRLPHRYVLRGATGRPQPAAGPPAAPVRTARRHWPPAARSWAACRTGTYCAAPLAARSPQLGRLPHRYVLRGATGRPQPAAGPPAAPVRTAQRHWPPAARSWAACRTGTYCAAPLAARSPQLGRLPHRYVLRGATGRPQPAAGPLAAPVRTARRHWPPAARSWAACRTGTYCAAPLAARSPQLDRLPHRYVLRGATGRPQPAAGPPAAPVRTARRHWPPAARSWTACRTGTYCAAPLAARSPQLGRLPHRYVLRGATGRPQPAAGPPAAPVRTARRHWPPAARSWAACRTGTYCAAPLAARSPQLGRLPHRYVLRGATGRPQPAAGPPAAPVRTARRHWPPAARSWAACRTGTYCAAPLAARSPQLDRLPHRYVLRGATGRPQPAAGPPAAPVRTARRHWPPAARSWTACRTGTYCAAPLAARSPQLGRLPHRYVLRGATGRPQPAAGPPAAPVRTARRHWPPAARSWTACRTGTYCAAPLAARSPQLGRLPHRYVLRGATGRPQPAAGPPAAPVRTARRHWPPAARSWAACRTGTYCAAPLAARSPQLGRLPHRYVLRSATGRPQPAAGPPAAPVRTARRLHIKRC